MCQIIWGDILVIEMRFCCEGGRGDLESQSGDEGRKYKTNVVVDTLGLTD